MIHIKMDGLDFENEIADVVRLFFKKESIVLESAKKEALDGVPGNVPEYADRNELKSAGNKELKSEPENPLQESSGIFLSGALEEQDGRQIYKVDLRCRMFSSTAQIGLVSGIPERMLLADRKLFKQLVKRTVYQLMVQYTGKDQPWGVLTGIRPAKIVYEMLEQGLTEEQIYRRLTEIHFVSGEKAGLLYRVAAAEKKLLDDTPTNSVGLYVGIPFCVSRCLYCSFTSNLISKHEAAVGPYLEALMRELEGIAGLLKETRLKIQSIYIGGGTPTSITSAKLSELLAFIENTLDLSGLREFTLEAGRPDTIDERKLTAIKSSRVDRISINPQTMNAGTLSLIGRSHSPEEVAEKLEMARKLGFTNINMDLIAGLPGENVPMFETTLREIAAMAPDCLTVHTMSLKRASRLNEEKGEFDPEGDGTTAEMTAIAAKAAASMGMYPYYLYRQKNILDNLENTGYCKPGFESIYNVQIMEEKQTILAAGAGGVTKVIYPEENRIERAFNVKDISHYIRRLDEMLLRKKELLDGLRKS